MGNRKIQILYGSETGTACDIAEELWRESKKLHFESSVSAMDSYQVESLISEDLVIFVASTTGQGEEPYNMKKFWKFLLRKSLPCNSLVDVKIAVLGLGDSSYQKFNFVAKRLFKRLVQLSAEPILNLGLCDDQHDMGLAAVYLPWKSELWQSMLTLKPLPVGLSPLVEIPQQFKWNVSIVENTMAQNINIDNHSLGQMGPVFEAEVLSNERTTANDHFQDVRLIKFSTESNSWEPGDVVYIRPHNSKEQVNALFLLLDEKKLNWYPDTVIQIEEITKDMPVPEFLRHPQTLETLATKYWDLNAMPRGRVFELLAINCENELEKEKLVDFTTPAGQEELYGYVNRPRRTILEVLYDFPHATSAITLQTLVEMFAPIKPRSFSIASSPKSGTLDLLVAVVEYKTILKVTRKGLCSNWLKNLALHERVLLGLKTGTFCLPKDQETPLIMIGPGTGLAPFRSIIQHRILSNKPFGPLVLFFGCRNKSKDFHCQSELEGIASSGLLMLITAFSRDQEDKVYVQHRLQDHAKMLNELLSERGGYFLVSGNSKNMPQAVLAVLKDVLLEKTFVDTMIKSGRYQEETWS